MEDTLRYLSEVANDPGAWLTKWKKENKRPIVGCAPMFVPEEIVHAAGAHPVVLWKDKAPVTVGHSRIQPFFCGIARSLVDLVLRGKFDFLDGIIVPDICIPMRCLPDVVKCNSTISFQTSLYLPKDYRKSYSRSFLIDELQRLRSSLSAFIGTETNDDILRRSIGLYNRHRGLMRRLHELRRQKPGIVTSSEMLDIVASGMIMPKEEHSKLLESLLGQLEARSYIEPTGLRLILSGSLCEWPKREILDLIEKLGGIVVDDELYAGNRYFATAVSDASPMDGLADAYLNPVIPCPIAVDPTNRWGDFIVKMATDNKAQGVIVLLVKYCEPHALYYPDIAGKLSLAGIPHFALEIEHEVVAWGQLKTRIAAFMETIQGKS